MSKIASVRFADGSRMEKLIGKEDDIQNVWLPSETVQIIISKDYCQLDRNPKQIQRRFIVGTKYTVKQLRNKFKNNLNIIEQLKDLPENLYMVLCVNNIILALNKKDTLINPSEIVDGYYRKPEELNR